MVEAGTTKTGGLSSSDHLSIALACLAGVMAVVLSFVEKTPSWTAALLAVMLALLIHPIFHFTKSQPIRISLVVLAVLLTAGFGWRVWPKANPSEVAVRALLQATRTSGQVKENNGTTDAVNVKVYRPVGNTATAAAKPARTKAESQDNSVHLDHNSRIEQQSSGDCSPNIVGGSNTVNCAQPPAPTHWYELDGTERTRKGGDNEVTTGPSVDAEEEMKRLLSIKDWAGLKVLAERQMTENPEWPTPHLFASFAYARLCQKRSALGALRTFIGKATAISQSTATYDAALKDAKGNLAALEADHWPVACN